MFLGMWLIVMTALRMFVTDVEGSGEMFVVEMFVD
jgi:hypothetical protein